MIRAIIIIISVLYVIGGSERIVAQAPHFSIFDSFKKIPANGEGAVIVHQSDEVKQLVGTRIDNENVDVINGKTYLITQGFRIQAYSGNNQRTSKDEAFAMQAKIKDIMPGVDTYVMLNAPFWKLLVGNYRSFEEASVALRELRTALSTKNKNEIYIIEDDIRLPLD